MNMQYIHTHVQLHNLCLCITIHGVYNVIYVLICSGTQYQYQCRCMYVFIMYASYADICVRNVGKKNDKARILYNAIIVTIIHKCTHNEAQCPESAFQHLCTSLLYTYIQVHV